MFATVSGLMIGCRTPTAAAAESPLDPEFLQSDLPDHGPKAEFASITESPFWALSDRDFLGQVEAGSWKLTQRGRVPTPYGLGPEMLALVTPAGRAVLFIRDYGRTPGGPAGHTV